MTEIKSQSIYSLSLILSTEKRKTCEALARSLEMSGDKLYNTLKNIVTTTEDLVLSAEKLFGKKGVFLIIDDTLLQKIFSKNIEGTSDNYDSSDHKIYRSLCAVTAMLTDGFVSIPIDVKIWTSKEFAGLAYKKKTELAQELIEEIRKKLLIRCVLMDGLYATVEMVEWCLRKDIPFECRFHSNRVITVENEGKVSLKHCKKLRITGGRRARTIIAEWKGLFIYITSVRRITKTGKITIVFQISNLKIHAESHVRLYDLRWNIEMFFRTAKQHLGFSDCQSRKLELQINHIKNVFLSYHFLQWETKRMRLKCPEDAIDAFRKRNFDDAFDMLCRPRQIFHTF